MQSKYLKLKVGMVPRQSELTIGEEVIPFSKIEILADCRSEELTRVVIEAPVEIITLEGAVIERIEKKCNQK